VKKIALAMVLGVSMFGVTAMAEEWSGTISDSKCGKGHADASEKSQACVKKCVEGGASAVFVTGDKVLKISDASMDKVKPHLGHKVTITGSLTDDTVTVDTIRM
jgi:hypothetical protein